MKSLSIQQKLSLLNAVRHSIRRFLNAHNYVEADVPVLAPSLIPESYLEPFATTIVDAAGRKKPAYLTASPEAFLKRLLSMGLNSNVFYLGKAFRNGEPTGRLHNHEFTLLEWYQMGGNYESLMEETEKLIKQVAKQMQLNKLLHCHIVKKTWKKITVKEAFKRYVPIIQQFNNLTVDPDTFNKYYVQYIEPHLGFDVPTFLIDFPVWSSPLAISRGSIAERFELYINGIELVNGWTELTDWKMQQKNLEAESEARKKYHMTHVIPDKGFVEALKRGMPACAGAAMGVDRLTMVLSGGKKLSDILPFTSGALFY